MKIGTYEFPWEPDEISIPRPVKSVAIAPNKGNVGFMAWSPIVAGTPITMKWEFMSVAQFNELLDLYYAGGQHVVSFESVTIETTSGGPTFAQYPDPSYPGELPGPPWRRFSIGAVHNGPWTMDAYVYLNYAALPDFPTEDEGTGRAISVADPANSYIDIGPWGASAFPGYRVGDSIYDDAGVIWAVIVPYDPAVRQYYLYPRAPVASDKIYYTQPYGGPALQIGDDLWIDPYDTGYVAVTEVGTDTVGAWFKCAAQPTFDLITWTAGEYASSSTAGQLLIQPWASIGGGAWGETPGGGGSTIALHEVPTGQTALKYNVVIGELKMKFFDVVDFDATWRKNVELTLIVRSVEP